MRVQHNILELSMSNNLKTETKMFGKSMEKLSSGFQINRAADNAAGLKISQKMHALIRGLNQARNNVMDGISYCQTAEGALHEVVSMVQRIRELAVQSANGTNTNEDRKTLDDEVQALKSGIRQIFFDTEFNTRKIWEDGEDKIQIGTDRIVIASINNNYSSGKLTDVNKFAVPENMYFKILATEEGMRVTWDAFNGKNYTSDLIAWSEDLSGLHSFHLKDYIDTVSNPELEGLDFVYSYSANEEVTLEEVVNMNNHRTVSFLPYTHEQCNTYFESGMNKGSIRFTGGISYVALLASGKTFDFFDTGFIERLTEENLVNDPTDIDAKSDKWIFKFTMPGIGEATATSASSYYYSNWRDPEKIWWDWAYYSSGGRYKATSFYVPENNNGSLSSVLESLNNDKGHNLIDDTISGGYITVRFAISADAPYQVNNKSYSNIGYLEMDIPVSATDTIEDVKKKLNLMNGLDVYAGNQIQNTPSSSTYSCHEYSQAYYRDIPVYTCVNRINLQVGANEEQNIKMEYWTLRLQLLGIKELSVDSEEAAQNAITQADRAMGMVTNQLSLFGSYENRLEHAYQVDALSAENMEYSVSRIEDTEIAKETVELSKHQICMQACEAMLAHTSQNTRESIRILIN